MEIDIFSDIHLDHWMVKVYSGKKTRDVLNEFIQAGRSDADAVIFAGDAGNGSKYYELVMKTLEDHYSNVIGTPGNHDFYRRPGYTDDHFVAGNIISKKLKDNWQTVDKILSFAACPLWTNFRNKPEFGVIAEQFISDWMYVPELVDHNLEKEGWEITFDEYKKYRDKLMHLKPDIAVTHFAPIVQSVHPKYAGDALNPYFCNDDEEMFNAVGAKLWVHGHTHSAFDYVHGKTRVVANPIGYPYENYKELIGIPMKTVDVKSG